MIKKKIFILTCLFTILFSLYTMNVEAAGFGFKRNPHHLTPDIGKYQSMLDGTSSFYVGDTSKKIVYLTFDAGYDNGELDNILNTLKEKDVKASFFITGDFVKRFSDLTYRMRLEGHVMCNHSYSHKKIQTLSKKELKEDLEKLNNAYFDLTGYQLARYFRPPEGEFTKDALKNVQELGYKTVFWSIAYCDWDSSHQASVDKAIKSVIDNLHNGAIILLHSVSKTNSLALGEIIDEIKNQGYSFRTVLDL